MNQELRQKIAQTIIDKDCLFQIEKDKKDFIIYNISAFVTEMLEANKEFVSDCLNIHNDIKLYSYEEFVTLSTHKLYGQVLESYVAQTVASSIHEYFDTHRLTISKYLNTELNEGQAN